MLFQAADGRLRLHPGYGHPPLTVTRRVAGDRAPLAASPSSRRPAGGGSRPGRVSGPGRVRQRSREGASAVLGECEELGVRAVGVDEVAAARALSRRMTIRRVSSVPGVTPGRVGPRRVGPGPVPPARRGPGGQGRRGRSPSPVATSPPGAPRRHAWRAAARWGGCPPLSSPPCASGKVGRLLPVPEPRTAVDRALAEHIDLPCGARIPGQCAGAGPATSASCFFPATTEAVAAVR